MAYNQFKLRALLDDFDLELRECADLFAAVSPRAAGEMLQAQLQENVSLAVGVNTEKARSELIIAPILSEVRRQFDYQIGFFSGVEFNIAPEPGIEWVLPLFAERRERSSASQSASGRTGGGEERKPATEFAAVHRRDAGRATV
ncbi:MAG: hypothetical protein ACFB9N_05820 [Geitlerinemataceae cyanobacterium]